VIWFLQVGVEEVLAQEGRQAPQDRLQGVLEVQVPRHPKVLLQAVLVALEVHLQEVEDRLQGEVDTAP